MSTTTTTEQANAARLERRHPGWTVLWSPYWREYWAAPRHSDIKLWACTAEALSIAIADVERERARRAGVIR